MVRFPEEHTLRSWIKAIEKAETSLRHYLPHIDEGWYKEMMSCIEITEIVPSCRTSLSAAGAKLFHKIIKNHHRIDGNKRSALLVTVLFFVHNDYFIAFLDEDMYELAEYVAKDSRKPDIVEADLDGTFKRHMRALSR